MVMSTETVAAPKLAAWPWVLINKLPVVVMLSVVNAPSVFNVTVPALCKGASVNADAVDTETSAHDPPLASLRVSMPVNLFCVPAKVNGWSVPVSAVNVVVPPIVRLALAGCDTPPPYVVMCKLPPMSTGAKTCAR